MATMTPPALPPTTSSSAAEMIGENDDLLSEILSNLPIRPLLRFKSVNKQWNSLISHPSFSLLHCHRHLYPPSSALFYLHHRHHHPLSPLYHFITFTSPPNPLPPILSPLTPPSPSIPFDILQSSNGLLLCSSGPIFFVCNPTLNSIATICNRDDHRLPILGLNLGFDPARWPHYRVLRVSASSMEENSYVIDVYSSDTHQWRSGVVDPFAVPFDVEFSHAVYWEGRVHWLSHTEFTCYFDFETECVSTLNLPDAIQGSYIERFRYFGESRGHLHLIEIRTNCVQEFEVLELDKDKLEWFVKYRVNLDVLGRGFESEMFLDHVDRFGRGFRFYAFSILAVVRENVEDVDVDIDDSRMFLSIPGKVIAYNFRTKESRLVCCVVDESDKLFPFRGHTAFQFIQSLYCV